MRTESAVFPPGCHLGCTTFHVTIGELHRLPPPGALYQDSGVLAFASSNDLIRPLSTFKVQALHVTPPTGSIRPDAAYIAMVEGSDEENRAPKVRVVEGVRDFDAATIEDVALPKGHPPYLDLVPSPVATSDIVYALYDNGVDAIHTLPTHSISPDALTFPSGFSSPRLLESGVVKVGQQDVPLVFVGSQDRLLVYDPATGAKVDDVPLPGSVSAMHLSVDGRFLLLTRVLGSSETLLVLDAATRSFIRESAMVQCAGPCPVVEGQPMALTIDGSHAIVSTPSENELKYVYLTPPRAVVESSGLSDIVASVPLDAYAKPGDRQKLTAEVGTVTTLLDMAEQAPTDQARQALLSAGEQKLETVVSQVDGCTGGDPGNDLIETCAEKQTVLGVATDLSEMVQSQQVLSGCPTEPPSQ